ncbi:MAG: 3-deoxy-D-manno-octulosonic acid transferase [Desulfobacterales bacterium]|nr:3-deoxy-D-manno-octulosonic acid transferase [Desulfobacterales bacterium]
MTKCAFIPNFLRFYNILWQAALPFLKQNSRLAPTFEKRISPTHLKPADVWIQAASAGEAFLAVSILKALKPDKPLSVLVTTTTDQGRDILENGLVSSFYHPNITLQIDMFPFDMPDTVKQAVQRVNPKVMVLLETELWPALLYELKQSQTKVLILNGRLSKKSGRNYKLTRWLWNSMAPDLILATSSRDAKRFSNVFTDTRVSTMNNIKFDHMGVEEDAHAQSKLGMLIPQDLPLSILASFRRQEEPQIIKLISALKKDCSHQVIALFPRHMHRIAPFLKQVKKQGLDVVLGSELNTPIQGPAVILWDRFGELRNAYAHANAVFVGGSLCPLGGQNFMEPAVLGIPTITGPYWDDFFWVGKEIFDCDIVIKSKDWKDAAQTMVNTLGSKAHTADNKQKAMEYITSRQGGSKVACQAILDALD